MQPPSTAIQDMTQQIATTTAIRTALKTSLYPGASDDSVDMVLAYCRAAQLDPMTKPVHIVPIWIGEKKNSAGQIVTAAGMRDVVMPGIELYRTKAHRTGEYAGQDDAEFGPTIDVSLSGTQTRFPEWCKVTVYRMLDGQRVPFSARVYWLESYATAKRDSEAPNAMWRKRPFGQLEKCAEALALRKAFPEAVGAQPTAEEMEGKAATADVVTDAPTRAEPVVLPDYDEASFAANYPSWERLIKQGKQTAESIIDKLSSKGRLMADQVARIKAIKPDAPIEGEFKRVDDDQASGEQA